MRVVRIVVVVAVLAVAVGALITALPDSSEAQTATASTKVSDDRAAMSHTGGLPVVAASVGLLVVIGIGGAVLARLAKRRERPPASVRPAGAKR